MKYTEGSYNNIIEYATVAEDISYTEKQEEDLQDTANLAGSEQFQRILDKVFGKSTFAGEKFEKDVIQKAFYGSSGIQAAKITPTSRRIANMWRVFAPSESGSSPAEDLSKDQLEKLFVRIEASGLLNLATYAIDIKTYAEARLNRLANNNIKQLDKRPIDVQWQQQLVDVTSRVSRDPILLSIINVYFPSLVKFYFEALAVVGDYSNNGLGGGKEDEINNVDSFIDSLEKAFGLFDGKKVFEHASKFQNTAKRIDEVLKNSPYRENKQPNSPDIFHLRLGAANFFVPPLSIDVNTSFKTGSLTGGALRQKNTPKFNSGYKETSVRMRLFFPNYEEIWGISIDDASQIVITDNYEIDFKKGGSSEEKIDKFLSSLRGLVAAFKYSPILPIRNHYLNSVHGITAVALSNMSVSTVPNFPFALAVDIELLNFNHKTFLPMINDFNQAVHWGKYRQYMGKAAGVMHNYVNSEFLMKKTDLKNDETNVSNPQTKQSIDVPDSIEDFSGNIQASYKNDILTTNVLAEWRDGNHLSFFIPAETQTKIFMPDNTMFRTDQEKLLKDYGGEGIWENLLRKFGIDVNQSAGYGIGLNGVYSLANSGIVTPRARNAVRDALDILTAGQNSKDVQSANYAYLAENFVKENKSLSSTEKNYILDEDENSVPGSPGPQKYTLLGQDYEDITLSAMKDKMKKISSEVSSTLDKKTDELTTQRAKQLNYEIDSKQYKNLRKKIKQELKEAFNVSFYERFFQSGPIRQLMENAWARSGSFLFREWEVPMNQVDLDPNSVTINGVTLTMGNNLAKLQLQMQDEPTYQHIGGKDTYVNISMTVVGEKELMKIKRVFDHINNLARLEHSTGVIGFMGIKNIITTLCGVKYVIPLNYSVNTTPNFPHVYQVNLSLIDFDIFQQTREKISSKQQAELIDHFQTKKNPFLRIKQMWGSFNAYPDFPLQIKDKENNVVGHLDPDFYFRSFDTFDRDVINNISEPKGEIPFFMDDESIDGLVDRLKGDLPQDLLVEQNGKAAIVNLIINWMREYSNLDSLDKKKEKIKSIKSELDSKGIYVSTFLQILSGLSNHKTLVDSEKKAFEDTKRKMLILDFIEYSQTEPKSDEEAEFVAKIFSAPYKVGDVSSTNSDLQNQIEMALAGEFNLEGEEEISFDPDELTAHAIISMMPIRDPNEPHKIPSTVVTAYGVNFGYIDTERNGRFYLTVDGVNQKRNKARPKPITDPSRPEEGAKNPTTFPTAAAFARYQQSMSSGTTGVPEVMGDDKPHNQSVAAHWEKMLVDTQYRDVAGRMIRAFPTYMLWLIDEGGYFAGFKMFDNFYGLQSIIDFSVVSSEDVMGDTLVFRVSNLYSKLTRKESDRIFGPESDGYNQDNPTLTDSLSSIIDGTLNKAKYILANMKGEYVVDIENIRLKPGVRVHLRGGYGSNPNSLQTLFNGTITEVQTGEIITVTAQSDAIELGAIVNSTNKNGDSGKIDGGINTGLWLSEPRDLMVRLLSMGTSRFREGFAYASRGIIFSENKFGIRHFGSMLYEPMNTEELSRHTARIDAIADAKSMIGSGQIGQLALDAAKGAAETAVSTTADAFGFSSVQGFRPSVFGLMSQMWANFTGQRDLEIFKRNIYPGNGTGIAQFLGGDIGDGWTSVASITPESMPNDRLEYLGRLTDRNWNNLLASYQNGSSDAKAVVDQMTAGKELNVSGSADIAKNLISIGVGAAVTATPIGGAAAIGLGLGLTGVLSGRGGTSIFRTIGLISANDDDDMPGFDEVSFRAQTYMRTVWDLFQTCARLLPNYIVAIRPFEDRSTVFYGKPHWLYTSGVVPVTTGYPGDAKAAELGIIPPQIREPDMELLDIIEKINKESSVYSDAEAFLRGSEEIDALKELAGEQMSENSIFAPAYNLSGKIFNLLSEYGQRVKDRSGKTIAKLPVNKGLVEVGLHLPVGGMNQVISAKTDIESVHSQIRQLPVKYSFPFFTDVESDEYYLYNYSYIPFDTEMNRNSNSTAGSQDFASDYFNFTVAGGKEYKTIFENLSKIDEKIIKEYDGINDATILTNTISFKTTLDAILEQYPNILNQEKVIRMPYPESNMKFEDFKKLKDESKEWSAYREFENNAEFSYSSIDYASDWGYPQTQLEEQFYIAMRWPYEPSFSGDKEALEAFKNQYFFNGQVELTGPAKNYKDQHVLVYSPEGDNGKPTAVVCKPAYFFWGDYYNNSTDDTGAAYEETAAIVSPDAAYYLGLLTEYKDSKSGITYSKNPQKRQCYFTFVPNTVPLGVAVTEQTPITIFNKDKNKPNSGQINTLEKEVIIGFGTFKSVNGDKNIATKDPNFSLDLSKINDIEDYTKLLFEEYKTESSSSSQQFLYGGNYTGYMADVISGNYNNLTAKAAYDILDKELSDTGGSGGTGRATFADVFSIFDEVGREARTFYDEDFSPTVSVIAGNGRTLKQARDIWDQFRFGYHTYESVKDVFFNTYGIDPDDETEFSPEIKNIIFSGKNSMNSNIFSKFRDSGQSSGVDEFSILLGSDISNTERQGIDYVTQKFIDAPLEEDGIVSYFNELLKDKLKNFYDNFLVQYQDLLFPPISSENAASAVSAGIIGTDDVQRDFSQVIKTPKQLFLFMVAIFRQRMWSDAYSRAWLVLKPNRKMTGAGVEGQWDFRPVDKMFAAFINPYNTYGKDSTKFTQLLYKNKGEGSSATNIVSKTIGSIDSFLDRTIGPVITAVGDALSSLINMYKINMLQTGYGLSQIGNFAKQANILNKVLNDSIYYSLGRPGSLLRAVDNPFTREYGEPVVEIREPFQRIHYISSFSHILTNQIQENLAGVATVVTAVSDGKYPVTVALDKGAPAERQTETTVETGIYFDNVVGSGFFGFLHPILHPFETGRGISKNVTGAPDELSAKRIALSHLRESVKDIYGGELIIIGNPDIRPYDLVYLADIYERMYGIFEVEQVIHHFTPELGFITSITPNALVTVNDPAKWFMSSWIHSWLSVQNMRNDTRIYLDSLRAGNTGITLGGNISVDGLAESLSTQMIGAMQYTHGSSALIKDIVASTTAQESPSVFSAAKGQAQINGNNGAVNASVAIAGLAASSVPILGQIAWKGWQWVRDNLLDQHGCYVQYLNKNGQAMDAGLSYNQGMVVGRYHSKALLPGILGSRVNTRTQDGYGYIRTDDLFKSLGWSETEIKSFVRYSSYENALVHSQILGMSGLGPEKAGLEPMFKSICVLDTEYGQQNTGVIDADTIQVKDVLSGKSFRIRFDGINAAEKSEVSNNYNVKKGKVSQYYYSSGINVFVMQGATGLTLGEYVLIKNISSIVDGTYRVAYVDQNIVAMAPKDYVLSSPVTTLNIEDYPVITAPANAEFTTEINVMSAIDLNSPGAKATAFTINALKNKVFVVRIPKSREKDTLKTDEDYDAGSPTNDEKNYLKERYGRTLGTIFYRVQSPNVQKYKDFVYTIFVNNQNGTEFNYTEIEKQFYNSIKIPIFESTSADSFSSRYNQVLTSIENIGLTDYSSGLFESGELQNTRAKTLFNKLVSMKIVSELYSNAAKWPFIGWDEYYEDGTPATLNWDLVVNNFANVYTNDLLTQSSSYIDANEASTRVRSGS